jgi:hypothetical protein
MSMSTRKIWKCAACSPPWASSRASRSSRTRRLATCSTRPRRLQAKWVTPLPTPRKPSVANGTWYPDRKWLNVFPGNATFTADTFNYIDPRTGFFTNAYSASPGMAVNMENVGAKDPATFVDAKGEFLSGSNAYTLNLPKGIPAALFWSVTVYDSITASGVDNGQPFPSLNTMDKPQVNADGSIDVHFGPDSPGEGKNWIRTLPGKGFFVILRLYGPTKTFFDKAWKPGDLHKQ